MVPSHRPWGGGIGAVSSWQPERRLERAAPPADTSTPLMKSRRRIPSSELEVLAGALDLRLMNESPGKRTSTLWHRSRSLRSAFFHNARDQSLYRVRKHPSVR